MKRLGIDEIALHKGQGNFVVVLVDLDTHKPIALVKSRKQVDIRSVMESWGMQVRERIQEVSIDMSVNYKSLVTALLPNADITVDRFHVMQTVNSELNQARIQIVKAGHQLEKPAKTRVKAALSKSKYIWLTAESNLNEFQRDQLAFLKQIAPLLARKHQLKENFREIFETAHSLSDGTLKLLDWLVDAHHKFPRIVGTITRWFGEVIGYFEQGTTSGIVEGINNKLKLVKRSGYGFRNFDNFQLRSLICWYAVD